MKKGAFILKIFFIIITVLFTISYYRIESKQYNGSSEHTHIRRLHPFASKKIQTWIAESELHHQSKTQKPKASDTSLNIDLITFWPYGTCEGAAIDSSRNIALLGNGYALQILDISTPSTPTLLGEVTLPQKARDIEILGNYAYVLSWNTLIIVDISSPSNPYVTGSEVIPDQGYLFASGFSLAVIPGYAFASVGELGCQIFNVTDPTDPEIIGTVGGSFNHDVAIGGNYLYLLVDWEVWPSGYVTNLLIYNISTPSSPIFVGDYESQNDVSFINVDATDTNYVYVTQDDISGGALLVIDVGTDPANPSLSGSYADASWYLSEIAVSGIHAYVFESNGCQLKVLNIATPSSPAIVGTCATISCSCFGFGFSGNYVGIAGYEQDFGLYDVSTPTLPSNVATYETVGNFQHYGTPVVLSGEHTFLSNRSKGLRVLDMSTPSDPQAVGLCDNVYGGGGISISGNYVYGVDGSGLWVVDISSPASPSDIATYSIPWTTTSVAVSGQYAYVCGYEWVSNNRYARLYVLDISDPTYPSYHGSYNWADASLNPGCLALSGDYAYVGLSHCFKILDISDPDSPDEIGSLPLDYGGMKGVVVQGDYAYLANCGLLVIDVSDPTNPSDVYWSYDAYKYSGGIALSGNFAYLASRTLRVFDISNPESPSEVGYYYDDLGAGYSGDAVAVSGNYAYVLGSLMILKNTLAPEVDMTTPSARSTVSGSVSIDVTASHTSGITQVELYIDNTLQNTDTSTPYNYVWSSTSVANGLHMIRARAYNTDGNSSDAEIEVTVENNWNLTISSTTGGTTDPVPDTYSYGNMTPVEITAISNSGYDFTGWTGDVPSGHEKDNPVILTMDSNKSITANFSSGIRKDDLLGTWGGQGVYYRNSDTGSWVKLATPATKITAGNLDNDGIDDLIGIWPAQGGVWVKYSQSGSWAKLSSTADWISAGDMNGDGMDDLLGTWTGQGVYYRNSANGQWVKLASPATQITTGDLDEDGMDDLVGIWPTQGGVWVKYSGSGTWERLSSTADWIACGDMDGDGRDDLLGTWTGQGVYYRNSANGQWIKMASPATQITAGDLDEDGMDDLVGIWPTQGGVWVKYSSSESWERLSSTADWIACGKMNGGAGGGGVKGFMILPAPIGGYAEGPGSIENYLDISSEGPGGWNFIFQAEENLFPQEQELKMMKLPGPGEPGFRCIEQKNLFPQEKLRGKRGKKKEK